VRTSSWKSIQIGEPCLRWDLADVRHGTMHMPRFAATLHYKLWWSKWEHRLRRALAWFAVGCYYYCIRNFDR
jgi:hypothetical protein